jgi:hypothetical protein
VAGALLVDRDVAHAAVVSEGALARVAGGAGERFADDARRAGDDRAIGIGRAEDRDRGNGESGGEMQRTAVVRDDHRAVRDRGGEREDVAVVADHRDAVAARGDRLRLHPFAGAGQQEDVAAVGAEAVGHFAVAVVAPMFRPAVKSAGVDAEERAIELDAELAEAAARFLPRRRRQRHRRDLVDHARRVHRGEQRRVVLELMSAGMSRGTRWVRSIERQSLA